MTTASQLYYALWHPDGSERIVCGYAETIGFDRTWKRRAFHSVSDCVDWLDGVRSSRYEDKIRRLESELERMTAERDELEHLLYKERTCKVIPRYYEGSFGVDELAGHNCSECGTDEIDDEMNFCPSCGAKVISGGEVDGFV